MSSANMERSTESLKSPENNKVAENDKGSKIIPRAAFNITKFEAASKLTQTRLLDIILDAAVLVACNEKLPRPQKRTAFSILSCWTFESDRDMTMTKLAWKGIQAQHPCCLRPQISKDDGNELNNFEERQHKYRHDECATLALSWAVKIRDLTLRHTNLRIALNLVKEKKLDLGSFGNQAKLYVRHRKDEALAGCSTKVNAILSEKGPSTSSSTSTITKTAKSSTPPKVRTPKRATAKYAKSPSRSPGVRRSRRRSSTSSTATKTSQISSRGKHRSVTFTSDVLLLGQEDEHRSRRSYRRGDSKYVPGHWAASTARLRHAKPESKNQHHFEEVDDDSPVSFSNTHKDYSTLVTQVVSDKDDDDIFDNVELSHSDAYLDTSGLNKEPEDFYHDDPLLYDGKRALEDKRRAVEDTTHTPTPVSTCKCPCTCITTKGKDMSQETAEDDEKMEKNDKYGDVESKNEGQEVDVDRDGRTDNRDPTAPSPKRSPSLEGRFKQQCVI